ncbi:MAG: hypothetical protein V3U16_02080, partial [Candidatus Neomarinimicrobiota bacterium]
NAAGATNCATGKFFNLRRFTLSRFEEPLDSRGGQLPYWFEHSLLAFVRRPDLARLENHGLGELVGVSHSKNHWGDEIQSQFLSEPTKAWLRLSWRHYLSWFSKAEYELSKSNSVEMINSWLLNAEQNWQMLEDSNVLLDEPRNNGAWIRPWRQALIEYQREYSI